MGKLFLLSFLLFAQLMAQSVIQKVTVNQNLHPDLTFEQIKSLAIKEAKKEAAAKIYGELIVSSIHMTNGRMQEEGVSNISGGIIHLKGDPRFSNGKHFGEITVEIEAYASDDEIKQQRQLQKETSTQNTTPTSPSNAMAEKDFYGSWSGYVNIKNNGMSKAIVVISPTAQSTLVYKNLRCEGDLLTKNKDTRYAEFKFFRNYGSSKCQDKTKVMIEKVHNNQINFEQFSQDGESIAQGTLYREN